MNKTQLTFLIIITAVAMNGFAKDERSRLSSKSVNCKDTVKPKMEAYNQARNQAQGPVQLDGNVIDEAIECHSLAKVASLNGADLLVDPESKHTMDRTITCEMKAGYTLDYKSCLNALKVYNWIKVSEQALTLQEEVRTQNNNKRLQEKVAERSAQGDVQGASIDAVIETNKQMKQMNQERMAAYTAAVGALGSALAMWQGSDAKGIQKACANKTIQGDPFGLGTEITSTIDCKKAITKSMETQKQAIFANEDAKGRFTLELTKFVAQGVKAGIAANQFKNVANKLEGAKQVEQEHDDIILDKCVLAPADPSCIKPGQRISGQKYQGSDFSMGSGNNNSFGMEDGADSSFGEIGDLTDIKDPETVAGVNNPFMDEAKQANEILNPAGAASSQGGGAGAAGGGGGGGGGLGGGGGASLGDDLQGADSAPDKEAEIKASKVAGSYNKAGAKGFTGVQGGKEEANPFSSLFDAKSEGGGIEEDRSIASGDIDGEASGLFQKISKRYGQVQADKRIEANNLE
jgi:hypothetical protein